MLLLPYKAYLLLVFFMSICTICAVTIYFAENTINSLISLLGCVVFSSCSLLILRVEFLSFAYIIVYGGAVVVLFLFVVLSTDLRKEDT
jgi:NADH-quinone oxidoreductase subunit J